MISDPEPLDLSSQHFWTLEWVKVCLWYGTRVPNHLRLVISRGHHHFYVDMTRLSFVGRGKQACICVCYSRRAFVMLSLLVAMLLTGATR